MEIKMKKLLISLLLLSTISNTHTSASAAGPASRPVIPATFNPTTLPQARELDVNQIILLLTRTTAQADELRETTSENPTTDFVQDQIATSNYITQLRGTLPPEKVETLVQLLTFFLDAFIHRQGTEEWTDYIEPELCSVALGCCGCITGPWRATQALFTILATMKLYQSKELKVLNYVSIASGKLKQDYLVLAALLKLGVEDLDISVIDPKYKPFTAFEERAFASITRQLKDIHSTRAPDGVGPREIKEFKRTEYLPLVTLRNYKEERNPGEEAPYKEVLLKDLYHTRIGYLQHQLQEIREQVNAVTGQEQMVQVRGWESTDEYLERIQFYATRKKDNWYQPHVLLLSDSADDLGMLDAIWGDFEKIRTLKSNHGAVVSMLDKARSDRTYFLDIVADDRPVVKTTFALVEAIAIEEPATAASSAPGPGRPIATAAADASAAVTVEPLNLETLKELLDLILGQEVTLQEILESLENDHHREQFQKFHDGKRRGS
jgi:hypothetical protein